MSLEISVVIPVYNSEKSLDELYERLTKVLSETNEFYEIILVDDGSRDSSYEKINKLRERDKRVKIIRLSKNFGQHNAIICGMNYSKGKYVVTMDDDLQNPPEEIPKLYQTIKKTGSDAVIGRQVKKEHSLFKNISSYLISKTYKIIFNLPEFIKMTNFRILTRDLVEKIIRNKNPNPVIGALMFINSLKIINIDIEHKKRLYGRSNYSLSNSFRLALDILINYSTIPLKLVSLLGLLCCAASLLWGLFILVRKLLGQISVPGWTTIIIVILFFPALICLSLALLVSTWQE